MAEINFQLCVYRKDRSKKNIQKSKKTARRVRAQEI
jgi:hypothetical protein